MRHLKNEKLYTEDLYKSLLVKINDHFDELVKDRLGNYETESNKYASNSKGDYNNLRKKVEFTPVYKAKLKLYAGKLALE